MSRRRIEMFQYRTVLAQIRRGASDREIARGHYMGRRHPAPAGAAGRWLARRPPGVGEARTVSSRARRRNRPGVCPPSSCLPSGDPPPGRELRADGQVRCSEAAVYQRQLMAGLCRMESAARRPLKVAQPTFARGDPSVPSGSGATRSARFYGDLFVKRAACALGRHPRPGVVDMQRASG